MSRIHTLTALRLAAAAAAFGLAGASSAVAQSGPDVPTQSFVDSPASFTPIFRLPSPASAPTNQSRIRFASPGDARSNWPAIVHFHWVGQDRPDTDDTKDLEREFLRAAPAR